jgi:hypothetical protein
MATVEKWGEAPPEGWYQVRVEKGEERASDAGFPTWALWLKAQNEPYVGRIIFDQASLQPHALAKLKGYYEAAGYTPGPEGHDPTNLNGKKFYVLVQHEEYQGQVRGKVPPYGIKSLTEGPAGKLAGT